MSEPYRICHRNILSIKLISDKPGTVHFTKAISIDKHDSDSYYLICYMYEYGQGVAKNYEKALEHCKLPADLEHESAKKALINLTRIMYK